MVSLDSPRVVLEGAGRVELGLVEGLRIKGEGALEALWACFRVLERGQVGLCAYVAVGCKGRGGGRDERA